MIQPGYAWDGTTLRGCLTLYRDLTPVSVQWTDDIFATGEQADAWLKRRLEDGGTV